MSFLKEFQYSNISQRKVIDYNNSLTFVLLGALFCDLSLTLHYYFFYLPVISLIILYGLGGLFLGNLAGKLLFTRIKNVREIYVFCELAFLIIALLYFLRTLVPSQFGILVNLFFAFKYTFPALILAAAFMCGIKINYSIRVSCGTFIDSTQGVERLILFMFFGISFGILLPGIFNAFQIPMFFFAALPLMIAPAAFLLNLPYNPPPLYTREDDADKVKDAFPANKQGEHLLFTYLNFLFMILYPYMGLVTIVKYYGDHLYIKLIFIILLFLFIAAGYCIGKLIRTSHLHIYGESFFPVAFMLFLIALLLFYQQLDALAGILLFVPVSLALGIVLHHSVWNIITNHDNIRRSTIIEFSLLMLPAPILIGLSLINFTNFWFFILLSVIMILNVVIPAIFLANSSVAGYKKAVFFFMSLFFLPLLIFFMLYFNIPLDSAVYVKKTGNFEELRNINYNSDYIKNNATVTMNNMPVFRLSDAVIRNYKRCLVPVALHHPGQKRILFISGIHRFFQNPVIGFFPNSNCLDTLADRDVDYNSLPFSGSQKYVAESDDLLSYLQMHKGRYYTIVDIPNLLDQNMNPFRFSGEYYNIIKNRIQDKGIFVQVFSVPGCRQQIFSSAMEQIRSLYKKQVIYCFSNLLVVLASDNEAAFVINQDKYSRLIQFFSSNGELEKLFLNDAHIVSHIASTGINDIIPFVPRGNFFPYQFLLEPEDIRLDGKFYASYINGNRRVLSLIDLSGDQYPLGQALNNAFQTDDGVLSLLKKTELAEARTDYRNEIRLLFELKKQAEYRTMLQDYVLKTLRYKEKYYYNAALAMEQKRKWEEAMDLYRAVLSINGDNFEANYRLGLLSITLQDIQGSFNYFQQAMRIRKDHPKVLYQIGVLYFSSGKFPEAIDHLNRALQQNEKSASIYRYLGICHQKTGNLPEAEKYFSKAMLTDPNDLDTKSRLDEVRAQISKDSKKWDQPEQRNESDVEQDADMPLPVTKSAYDVRLKDEDLSLPVIDPVSGQEIETKDDDKNKK